jgi:hypothetical protein
MTSPSIQTFIGALLKTEQDVDALGQYDQGDLGPRYNQ